MKIGSLASKIKYTLVLINKYKTSFIVSQIFSVATSFPFRFVFAFSDISNTFLSKVIS